MNGFGTHFMPSAKLRACCILLPEWRCWFISSMSLNPCPKSWLLPTPGILGRHFSKPGSLSAATPPGPDSGNCFNEDSIDHLYAVSSLACHCRLLAVFTRSERGWYALFGGSLTCRRSMACVLTTL